MENFNLKKFLVENKLTANSRMLSEEQEGTTKDFDGYEGLHIATVDGIKIYRLEDSDVYENCTYVWEYPNDTTDTDWVDNTIDIDVSGLPVSSEELQEYDDLKNQPKIADAIAADIAKKLRQEIYTDDEDEDDEDDIPQAVADPDMFSNDIRINPSLNERKSKK